MFMDFSTVSHRSITHTDYKPSEQLPGILADVQEYFANAIKLCFSPEILKEILERSATFSDHFSPQI